MEQTPQHLEQPQLKQQRQRHSGAEISCVNWLDLREAWQKAEPLLAKAAKKMKYSTDSIAADLWNQNTLLWSINDFEAVAVTRLIIRDTERVMWIEWVAGKSMGDWFADWERFQREHAKEMGCTAVEFQGRRAWEKHNKVHPEYKPIATIYRREV